MNIFEYMHICIYAKSRFRPCRAIFASSQITFRKRTRSESGEEMPDKFKNMTTEDIEKMGEEDRLEYTIHVSMKEASPNNNNNTEEEEMAAAIQVNRPLIVGDS